MKRGFIGVITFAFVLLCVSPAMAAIPAPIEKVGHGFVDVISSPVTLVSSTADEVKGADFLPLGLLKGIVKAPFHMIHQAGSGVLDIATFPLPK